MMNMMRSNTDIRSALLLVAVGVAFAFTSAGRGQCQYEVTAVFEGPQVWGSPAPIYVWDMNQYGHIVGYYSCIFNDEAFVWTPETGLATLPRLPGSGTARAYDINDNGNIVGYMEQTDSNRYTACLWKNGEVIDLGRLPGDNWSEALGINNYDQIVGYSNNTNVGPMHAFVWEDGEMTNLSAILGAQDSAAYAINDHGQITGWMGTWMFYESRAFILDGDVVKDLGVPPNGTGACGWDINEKGWVAGVGYLDLPPSKSLVRHGLLHRWGRMADLGPLSGDIWSLASDINEQGQAVGSSDKGGTQYRAVLWQKDCAFALDDIVSPGSELAFHLAGGVNDAGQIATNALDPSANLVGVLLTPHETVTGDVDSDCAVNIDDLFAVLGYWGPCEACPEDVNKDGIVNIKDLLIVIMNWG